MDRKLIIREATKQDIDALLHMEQQVVNAEKPFDHSLKDIGVKYYDLNELIDSDNCILLVATKDDEVIATGYAKLLEAKPYIKYDQYAYLGFMYTAPAQRGKGYNGQILTKLIRWCKTKKVSEIKLDVYSENISAIKAYEKANFKSKMIEMSLTLKEHQ